MNRLTSSLAALCDRSGANRTVAVAPVRSSRDSLSPAYHLLSPVHYEARYSYPLLVWLHSAGDDERQLRRVMPHVSLRNYVSVAPRGVVTESNGYSYSWCDASPELAWQSVHDALQIARTQYNVNPDRIFLAGMNDGGTMALRLALTQPNLFAGAVSIGGAFPLNCGALSRLSAVRNLPLLICRGLEAVDYSSEQMCEEIRLFHAAHMQVHYRQYPCSDELTEPMLRDVNAWLMEQVTGAPVLT